MNIDVSPTQGYPHMYDFISKKMESVANPTVIVAFSIVILAYYIIFEYLGTSLWGDAGRAAGAGPPQSAGLGMRIMEIFLWGMFIFLILINGIQYFFDIDIRAGIRGLFTPVPEVDVSITTPPAAAPAPIPEIKWEKQVFHVPNNKYTYEDAKALCAAYGARLADYSEIESAYNGGGEWCGFGWSANQMALYPTQENTWDKLQKIKGHKHDCGRPGVNGGFIANPDVRFGANCYGYKPEMTQEEEELLNKQGAIPMTKAEKRFQKRVEAYRRKLPEIRVSPFNHDLWSRL